MTGPVHILGGELSWVTPEDERLADEEPCCMGAAMRGAHGCTCWTPVYDQPQRPARPELAITTRPRACDDCAYRPDSPERTRGEGEHLESLPHFWCHQGMRRVVKWCHPDGRERPAGAGSYEPPIIAGVPFRADGSPGERCGGHAAFQRGQESRWR